MYRRSSIGSVPALVRVGMGIGALALIAGVVGCAGDVKPLENEVSALKAEVAALKSSASQPSSQPSKVEFAVTGVEWKGATNTDSLSAPSVSPKTLSGGYMYKAPGEFEPSNPKRWEVSSYVWAPGAMTVLQGDTVTLRTFIVNGDKHNTWVQAPDGTKAVQAKDLERGREYSLTFTASQVGAYQLVCASHAPTMSANITVLPRG